MRAIAITGHIINVGGLGEHAAAFDFDPHALRHIRYIGATFRTRSIEKAREISRRMGNDLWSALQAGRLRYPSLRSFRSSGRSC